MPISADEIETLVFVLLSGSIGATIAYVAVRNLRPIDEPFWLLFQHKYPFPFFFVVYVFAFFGLTVERDLREVLARGSLHVHSIAYLYLFALVLVVPVAIFQRLYSSRHRDAHA